MMNKILFVTAALLFQPLFSQKKEYIYYDKDWKVTTKENASFYRPMPLKEVENLTLLHDFYSNGIRQFEAYTLKNNENAYIGDVIWYDEKGNDETFRQYTNSSKVSELTYYHTNGNIRKKVLYKNGVKDGETIIYDYDGKELMKGIYTNGKPSSGNFELITEEYQSDSESTPPPATMQTVEVAPPAPVASYKTSDQKIKETKAVKKPSKTIIEQIFWANSRKLAQERIYSLDSYKLKLYQQKNYDSSGKLIQTINENDFKEYWSRILNGTEYQYYLQNNFATGIKSETKFIKEKKSGKALSYYPNGNVFLETNYKNGLREGDELLFNENGKLSSKRTYKESEPFNGNFDENIGRITTNSNYVNGKKDGESIARNEEKEIIAKGTYQQGKPFKGSFVIDNRDTNELINVENFKKTGLQKIFMYDLENLVQTYTLKNDQLNGITTFYNDGKAIGSIEYKDNEPYNGTLIDGELTTVYKNGKIVSETFYQDNYSKGENDFKKKKLYENGIITKIIDNSFTISAQPQKNYEGIYKNGKPYSGYFETDENNEFKQVNYYENGIPKFQYSNNYLENMDNYMHQNYDIKSTFKDGKIFDGVEYKLGNSQFISRHLKNGVLQSFDWDLFAMHYFNRIHFELKNNSIAISDLQKETKAEIKVDKSRKQLLVNGKIIDSQTFSPSETKENKNNNQLTFYYIENRKVVGKTVEIQERSYDNSEGLDLINKVYQSVGNNFTTIRETFEDLSNNIGSPKWIEEAEGKKILTAVRINLSGKPEMGILITPQTNNLYQLQKFEKSKMVKSVENISIQNIEEQIDKLQKIE